MAKFIPGDKDVCTAEVNGKVLLLLRPEKYADFNESLLGLGDIRQRSVQTDTIAAMFDLEGFTQFSKQIEPQLSVPVFLSEFLRWLFEQIRSEMTEAVHEQGARLYGPLPFFVKFMGDGLLVLWDVSNTHTTGLGNIIVSLVQICLNYKSKFLPIIRKKVTAPPPLLRCGVARGTVFSVGNGNDYVGSCINVAARMQKLPGVSFGFNRRGFDLEDEKMSEFFTTDIVVRRFAIRGIGDDELVCILRSEFDDLSDVFRPLYAEP